MKKDTCHNNTVAKASSNITSAKTVQLLVQEGIVVSEEQAKTILEFLYNMARIELDDHLICINGKKRN